MKTCTKCNEEKPLSEFYNHKGRNKDNLSSECKPCTKERNYAYNSTTSGRLSKRACKLRERGCEITNEQLESLLVEQTSCQICGSEESLCVDHCHDGKHVRGMLCNHCNTALGKFRDNVETLQKAIEYLKVHSASSE